MDDVTFAHVASLKQLQHLNIEAYSRLSDRGMAYLGQLPQLKYLSIHCSNVSNEGLAHLSALECLETLIINFGSKISNEGLRYLGKKALIQPSTLTLQ